MFTAYVKLSVKVSRLMCVILLFLCYAFLNIAAQKNHKHVMYLASLLRLFYLSEMVFFKTGAGLILKCLAPFYLHFRWLMKTWLVQVFKGQIVWVLMKKRQAPLWSHTSMFSAFAVGDNLGLVHTMHKNLLQFIRLMRMNYGRHSKVNKHALFPQNLC